MKPIGTLILAILLLSSCLHKEEEPTSSINGLWKSIGSGWLLQITDSTSYEFYDLTSISCIARRHGALEEIKTYVTLNNDTLSYQKGPITHQFTSIKDLPTLCHTDLSASERSDPLYNFDVFAETVKEHYAFIKLNKINWDELYKLQRSKLNAHSSDADLYSIIEETYELLQDNHAFIEATDEVYAAMEDSTHPEIVDEEDPLPKYGDFQVAQLVSAHHMYKKMTKDSWLVQWGLLADDIGYIQIKAMWLYGNLDIPQSVRDEMGYVDAYVETFDKMYEGDYLIKEVNGVKAIMDDVIDDLYKMKSIVIDVRFNGGGQDAVSFEILSRFISGRQQVATQKIRYGSKHTAVQPIYVQGSNAPYLKPIYVLTSPQTGSAAEAFSIATMALDHVQRIGSSTAGALSTTLDKTLPNGWPFAISNEVYMDITGVNYENIGIPVDYDLNYPSDRQTFFRSVVNDLEKDKRDILKAINSLAEL